VFVYWNPISRLYRSFSYVGRCSVRSIVHLHRVCKLIATNKNRGPEAPGWIMTIINLTMLTITYQLVHRPPAKVEDEVVGTTLLKVNMDAKVVALCLAHAFNTSLWCLVIWKNFSMFSVALSTFHMKKILTL
jgi:hypothetical protein